MDGFSYYNIFETKGIEYLVIIAFLLLLIPFWLALDRQVLVKAQIRKVLGVLSSAVLRIPQGIFYNRNHTWAHLERSGIAKVGLDDLLLHITGEVKIRHLKNPGDGIVKGELLAEMEQNGRLLRIFSPISGKIAGLNHGLLDNNGLLTEDPYGKGWICDIKPSNWVAEIPSCYLAEDATVWLKMELERYKDFLAINMGRSTIEGSMTILQDGGELSDNSLSALPDEMWQGFQEEFLNP